MFPPARTVDTPGVRGIKGSVLTTDSDRALPLSGIAVNQSEREPADAGDGGGGEAKPEASPRRAKTVTWAAPQVRATARLGAWAGAAQRFTRQAAAMSLARPSEEMGLAGPLGLRAPNEWRHGEPTAQAAACMAALRASFWARLLEATDARQTRTALAWFGDFVADTERVSPAGMG
eukprot:2245412-Pleurochrysis_carterae.AAC.2